MNQDNPAGYGTFEDNRYPQGADQQINTADLASQRDPHYHMDPSTKWIIGILAIVAFVFFFVFISDCTCPGCIGKKKE